jgi:aspartate/methionine/tyrosine aminotransferase
MATTAGAPSLRLSSRTSHFVLPKQWASMRKAEALERETGKRVIHFEKGDFQGEEFRPAPHIMEACAKAVSDGHVRYVPGPGLPELRDAIAEEATKRGRPTVREEVLATRLTSSGSRTPAARSSTRRWSSRTSTSTSTRCRA